MENRSASLRGIREQFLRELAASYPEQEIRQFLNLLGEEWLGLSRTQLLLESDRVLDRGEVEQFEMALGRLRNNEPIQYITGSTEFLGMKIKVKAGVLIPRPETEELAMLVISMLREQGSRKISLLDIGTGSGCLAIGIKKSLPEIRVTACDVSPDALTVAGQNARDNSCEVEFRHTDIHNRESRKGLGKFGVIVSNPPYIPESEKKAMHANVVKYEPSEALFVDDEEPLRFYEAIGTFAQEHLVPPGLLFFETHENFGPAIRKLLLDQGFREAEVLKDLHGKDRFILAAGSLFSII